MLVRRLPVRDELGSLFLRGLLRLRRYAARQHQQRLVGFFVADRDAPLRNLDLGLFYRHGSHFLDAARALREFVLLKFFAATSWASAAL